MRVCPTISSPKPGFLWCCLFISADLAVDIMSLLCGIGIRVHICLNNFSPKFCFVMPPPQCVERFHRYRSNEKNILASLLKFAGYIQNHTILPGNIFGPTLKNKMAARDIYSTLSKNFCWPSREKGIIGRDLKLAGYVLHYKILTGNICDLILKNKMAATGVSLSVMKSAYISLIIGPRGLG